MVSSECLRHQTTICLRLAATIDNRRAAATLVTMADDFIAKAKLIDEIEKIQSSGRPAGGPVGRVRIERSAALVLGLAA